MLICRPVMKEHMKYIIDHAEEIEKLIKVKAQVSEVKSIMLENIDKVCSCFRVRHGIFFRSSVISPRASLRAMGKVLPL